MKTGSTMLFFEGVFLFLQLDDLSFCCIFSGLLAVNWFVWKKAHVCQFHSNRTLKKAFKLLQL
jgi:hypothetical protein